MTKLTRRFTPALDGLELRITGNDGNGVIAGHAAVFYDGTKETEFELFRGLVERIDRSAFDRAMQEDDVRGLFNHNPDNLLGRSASGTLRLSTDKVGLQFELDLPDGPLGEQVRGSTKRGDLTGASFSFKIIAQRFETVDKIDIRTLLDVRLYDVGPVTFPAYEATDVSARSAYDDWRAGLVGIAERHAARMHALRTVELDLIRG